jgi:hypothetical protein
VRTDELDPYYNMGYAMGQLMVAIVVLALVILGIVAIVRNNSKVRRAAQSGASAPPAWYPDPEYPGHVRYWDGAQWTDHRQPAPQN